MRCPARFAQAVENTDPGDAALAHDRLAAMTTSWRTGRGALRRGWTAEKANTGQQKWLLAGQLAFYSLPTASQNGGSGPRTPAGGLTL